FARIAWAERVTPAALAGPVATIFRPRARSAPRLRFPSSCGHPDQEAARNAPKRRVRVARCPFDASHGTSALLRAREIEVPFGVCRAARRSLEHLQARDRIIRQESYPPRRQPLGGL